MLLGTPAASAAWAGLSLQELPGLETCSWGLGTDPPPTAPTKGKKKKKSKEFAPPAADSVRGEGFTGQEEMEPI